MFNLRGEVEVYPTEDIEKVKTAVENIFSYISFQVKDSYKKNVKVLIFESKDKNSLLKIREILKQEQIRDAAKKYLLENVEENKVTFYLNKQVAYIGRVSFCQPYGESPLGPIKVEVEHENPKELINWLTLKS
ncbi:MAG: RNA-binding domain-containing protein [Candidatus Bathyarchaeota archaeon]